MLQRLRDSIYFRVIWGVMALHLLNVSIDTPDIYKSETLDQLTFNEQETIIELVVETLLGYENAFAEYDESGEEKIHIKKFNKLEWFVSKISIPTQLLGLDTQESLHNTYYNRHYSKLFTQEISQPPEV